MDDKKLEVWIIRISVMIIIFKWVEWVSFTVFSFSRKCNTRNWTDRTAAWRALEILKTGPSELWLGAILKTGPIEL